MLAVSGTCFSSSGKSPIALCAPTIRFAKLKKKQKTNTTLDFITIPFGSIQSAKDGALIKTAKCIATEADERTEAPWQKIAFIVSQGLSVPIRLNRPDLMQGLKISLVLFRHLSANFGRFCLNITHDFFGSNFPLQIGLAGYTLSVSHILIVTAVAPTITTGVPVPVRVISPAVVV
jgi:hypothetical protein